MGKLAMNNYPFILAFHGGGYMTNGALLTHHAPFLPVPKHDQDFPRFVLHPIGKGAKNHDSLQVLLGQRTIPGLPGLSLRFGGPFDGLHRLPELLCNVVLSLPDPPLQIRGLVDISLDPLLDLNIGLERFMRVDNY
jgi:hypothetical protein